MCVPVALPSTTQALDTKEENTGPGHKPIMHRDANSLGIRGMAICHSSGIGETKTYSPGFGLGLGVISGSILFQI